jgi:hypothetical protein
MTGGQGWSWAELQESIHKEQVMENPEKIKVTVVDIKMPFSSMVLFMVKWAVASIPALTILFILGFLMLGMAGAMLPSMFKFFIKSLFWGCPTWPG